MSGFTYAFSFIPKRQHSTDKRDGELCQNDSFSEIND